jgi:large subunit ribosomal protein L10
MRPEKQLLLDEIKDQIDQSTMMVLASYQHMDPNLASQFRIILAQSGGQFEVVRKRILLKAAEAAGFILDLDQMPGHIGIVFTDRDPVQVTKTVYQFAKDHEEVLTIVAGRFEGRICSAGDVEQISKLPGRDEMRAQFLSTLEAPLAQTLAVIDALLTSLPHCLENKGQSHS